MNDPSVLFTMQTTHTLGIVCVCALQLGPGLEIAAQDSEKALQEALEASGGLIAAKTAADKALSKVREGMRGCCCCVWCGRGCKVCDRLRLN